MLTWLVFVPMVRDARAHRERELERELTLSKARGFSEIADGDLSGSESRFAAMVKAHPSDAVAAIGWIASRYMADGDFEVLRRRAKTALGLDDHAVDQVLDPRSTAMISPLGWLLRVAVAGRDVPDRLADWRPIAAMQRRALAYGGPYDLFIGTFAALSTFNAKDREEARHLAALLVARYPNSAVALHRAGLLTTLHNSSAALEYFQRAFAIDPKNPTIRYNLAMGLGAKGRWDESTAVLEGLVRDHPENEAYRSACALCYERCGRPEEAQRAWAELRERAPRHADANYHVGIARLAEGNHAGALRCFEVAVKSDPSVPDFRIGVGDALEGLTRFREAVAAYDAAARMHERSPRATEALALLHDREFRADSQERVKILSTIPEDRHTAMSLVILADALARVGDREEALRHLALKDERVSSGHEPADAEARLFLKQGEVLERLGEWQSAVSSFLRAAALDPKNSAAASAGTILAGPALDFERALLVFETALEEDPENPWTKVRFAEALAEASQHDRAEELARQVLARQDGIASYPARRLLALSGVRRQTPGKSIAPLRELVADSESPDDRADLAEALFLDGQREEAATEATQTLLTSGRQAKAWRVLGAAWIADGRLSEGIAVCSYAVLLDPNCALARLEIASALATLGTDLAAQRTHRDAVARILRAMGPHHADRPILEAFVSTPSPSGPDVAFEVSPRYVADVREILVIANEAWRVPMASLRAVRRNWAVRAFCRRVAALESLEPLLRHAAACVVRDAVLDHPVSQWLIEGGRNDIDDRLTEALDDAKDQLIAWCGDLSR